VGVGPAEEGGAGSFMFPIGRAGLEKKKYRKIWVSIHKICNMYLDISFRYY